MRQVKKGSINVSVDVYIIDATDGTPELGVLFDTAGMDLEYRRQGAVVVNITEATLAALTTAHADGGFLEIGHGYYRFDVPDAAFATGASTLSIQGTVTGMIILPQTIQLVDFDPEDGTRLGLTAIPNAAADAAGGLPISDAGALDLDNKLANTNEITVARMGALTDWINGGRLDLLLDAIKAVTDLLPDAGALTTIGIDTARLTAVRAAVLTDWINGGRLDLLLDAIPTTAMRGTDAAATAANLATVDTVVDAIKAVTDLLPNAGALTTIGADTARLTAARAAVLTDWINGGRLDLLLDAIPTTAMRGTDGANTTVPDAAGVVPALLPAALVGGRIDADIGAKTGNVALSAQEKLDVNAEALDVIVTDTHAEPGQGAPAATTSLIEKINFLYKAWRNKKESNATTINLYNDAGAVVDQKRTQSDDGTTYTKEKMVTGL